MCVTEYLRPPPFVSEDKQNLQTEFSIFPWPEYLRPLYQCLSERTIFQKGLSTAGHTSEGEIIISRGRDIICS